MKTYRVVREHRGGGETLLGYTFGGMPTYVFHGGPGTLFVFRQDAEAFCASAQKVVPDYPGMGGFKIVEYDYEGGA